MKSTLLLSSVLILVWTLFLSMQHRTTLKTNNNSNSLVQNFNKKITQSNGDLIYSKVEVEANIDLRTWREYLRKKLTYILDTINYEIPIGIYSVRVHFLVELDGSVKDAKALNDPGYSLAKFSEKVISESPKWNPGEIEEEPVRSYHTQPIIFIVEEGQTTSDTIRKRDFIL